MGSEGVGRAAAPTSTCECESCAKGAVDVRILGTWQPPDNTPVSNQSSVIYAPMPSQLSQTTPTDQVRSPQTRLLRDGAGPVHRQAPVAPWPASHVRQNHQFSMPMRNQHKGRLAASSPALLRRPPPRPHQSCSGRCPPRHCCSKRHHRLPRRWHRPGTGRLSCRPPRSPPMGVGLITRAPREGNTTPVRTQTSACGSVRHPPVSLSCRT